MASLPSHFTSEIALKLRLSKQTQDKLAQQAARTGRDVSDVASDLLEQAVNSPSLDEILAPIHADFASSGMSEDQIMELGRNELEALRRERKAKPA